jgi:hypothetical protein
MGYPREGRSDACTALATERRAVRPPSLPPSLSLALSFNSLPPLPPFFSVVAAGRLAGRLPPTWRAVEEEEEEEEEGASDKSRPPPFTRRRPRGFPLLSCLSPTTPGRRSRGAQEEGEGEEERGRMQEPPLPPSLPPSLPAHLLQLLC